MSQLARCDDSGHFEIKNLNTATYDIILQKEEAVGAKDALAMELKTQSIKVENADVDLGKLIIPLDATRKRYCELGLLSMPENIEDDGIYYVINSDYQAPTKVENEVQFEYESIYVVDSETYFRGWQEIRRAAKRVSGIGKRSSPAWNKAGDKIAYMYRSAIWDSEKIVLRTVATGEEQILKNVELTRHGLSWAEDGNRIAYRNSDDEVLVYDLSSESQTFVCSREAEHVALSPNAESICFMTRDSKDVNNADLWFLNVVDVKTGEITTAGKANDKFGLIGPFCWTHDSSRIMFSGFVLGANNKRKYAKYEYVLKTGTTQKYTGDFLDIYDQKVRYWIRPTRPSKR